MNSKTPREQAGPLRYALYRRVSDPSQVKKDLSLPEQADQQRAHVTRSGGLITHEFEEPGLSAKDADGRPAFLEMVAAAKRGEFDVILVRYKDRLFRNEDDADYYGWVLRRAGVRIESIMEPWVGSPSLGDKVAERVMDLVAAQKIKEQSDITAAGVRRVVTVEGRQHGHISYGYVAPPPGQAARGRQVDPETSERVRYLFERFAAEPVSVTALIAHLNALGWPSPSGGPWALMHLRRLLRNRTYIGQVKHHGAWFPGRHVPIVDPATFARVQIRLEACARSRGPAAEALLARGLLRCPCCHEEGLLSNLVLMIQTQAGKRYGVFHCGRHERWQDARRQGRPVPDWTCGGYFISERKVMRLLLAALEEKEDELAGVDWSRLDGPALDPGATAPHSGSGEAIALAEAELCRLPVMAGNYRKLFALERMTLDDLDAALAGLAERETALKAIIEAERDKPAAPALTAAGLVMIRQTLADHSLPADVRRDRLRTVIAYLVPAADKRGLTIYLR